MNKKLLDLIFWCAVIFTIVECILFFNEYPPVYIVIIIGVILLVISKTYLDIRFKRLLKEMDEKEIRIYEK